MVSPWHSIGKVGDFFGDLSDVNAVARAAQQRAYRGEVLLILISPPFADTGFSFVGNLQRHLGFEHYLTLAATEADCTALRRDWLRLQTGSPLACGWSSEVTGNPAWARWGIHEYHKYVLWTSRWLVAAQLCDLGVNVLVTDVDGAMLADVYPLLHSAPLVHYDVVITDVGPGKGVNCGFVYLRGGGALAAPAESARCTRAAHSNMSSPCRPAAAWLASAVYERIQRCLMLPHILYRRKPGRPVRPQTQVLWEAHVWNDVLLSVQHDRSIYSWAESKLVPSERIRFRQQLNGSAELSAAPLSSDVRTDPKRLVREATTRTFTSPYELPNEAFADQVGRRYLQNRSLQTMDLCAPLVYSIGGGRCLRSGRLVMAPPWLVSQGSPQLLSWSLATPRPSAHVHLVNMWRCAFTDWCYSRSVRMWWLRANGLYDEQLEHAKPREDRVTETTKTLALHPAAVKALARSGEFIRLHHALHHLMTVAALIGRRPLIPELPCTFYRTANARWLSKKPGSTTNRHGISLPDIVAVGEAPAPRCLLLPGGGTCSTPLHPFEMSVPAGTHPSLRLQDLLPLETASARIGAVCNLSRAFTLAPIVLLEGLDALPPDKIVDGIGSIARSDEFSRKGPASSLLAPLVNSAVSVTTAALRSCPAEAMERYGSVAKECGNYFMTNGHAVKRSRALSKSST